MSQTSVASSFSEEVLLRKQPITSSVVTLTLDLTLLSTGPSSVMSLTGGCVGTASLTERRCEFACVSVGISLTAGCVDAAISLTADCLGCHIFESRLSNLSDLRQLAATCNSIVSQLRGCCHIVKSGCVSFGTSLTVGSMDVVMSFLTVGNVWMSSCLFLTVGSVDVVMFLTVGSTDVVMPLTVDSVDVVMSLTQWAVWMLSCL